MNEFSFDPERDDSASLTDPPADPKFKPQWEADRDKQFMGVDHGDRTDLEPEKWGIPKNAEGETEPDIEASEVSPQTILYTNFKPEQEHIDAARRAAAQRRGEPVPPELEKIEPGILDLDSAEGDESAA